MCMRAYMYLRISSNKLNIVNQLLVLVKAFCDSHFICQSSCATDLLNLHSLHWFMCTLLWQELIFYAIYTVLFLIAAIVAAAKASYHSAIAATAVRPLPDDPRLTPHSALSQQFPFLSFSSLPLPLLLCTVWIPSSNSVPTVAVKQKCLLEQPPLLPPRPHILWRVDKLSTKWPLVFC